MSAATETKISSPPSQEVPRSQRSQVVLPPQLKISGMHAVSFSEISQSLAAVADTPLKPLEPIPGSQEHPLARRTRQRVSETFEPGWLSLLITLQRSSTPIMFLLVAGTLVVYGWSVYSQRAWSQSYRQLSHLQRQERELIAASETRKHQIAQQAESSHTGLVRQLPANTVFLKPEPPRSPDAEPKPPAIGLASSPIGY